MNLLFNLTINDNTYVYVTAHGCAGGLKKKLDLRSGSQRHRHSGGEAGLLEIKKLLHNKPVNLFQAASSKSFCLELKSRSFCLKKNYDSFYQCHGLINICRFPWIYFVVRTLNPYQLFIKRKYRDQTFWTKIMLPKLSAFSTIAHNAS